MHRHRRLLTQKRLIISQLEQVAILFQLFYGWTIYSPVCLFIYIYISNSDEIRTPQVEFAKQAYQFQNTFCENHDHTEEPVITSVYWVREVMHTWYCLSYFSNRPVMDQKPN